MKPESKQRKRPTFKSSTLKYTLLASILLAAFFLVSSHQALLTSHAKSHGGEKTDDSKLLSVPLPPRRQEAAKGGLPPIPEHVKRQLNNGHNENAGASSSSASIQSYPLPTEAVAGKAVIIARPTFGTHRPTKDAIFAFAEGYDLNVYVTFVESLHNTGYTGDVVLAVSYVEGMKDGVKDYLEWYSRQGEDDDNSLRVISYALKWECYKKSGKRILPTNSEGRGSTTNHGFSDCQIHGLYSDGMDETRSPAPDPREKRPVATARYELYWIFSRQYRSDSSILIIDVRDTYFQSNPFDFGPHASTNLQSNESEKCRIDLFEENYEAVNIGKSSYNSRWVKSAYGQNALKNISSKPVICSGSTMGSQRAIELYSTAMVAQWDKTKCKQVGCDQGFHNHLFYEGGLEPFLSSHQCETYVHKQGDGAVNNLAAMRNSPLRQHGILITTKSTNSTIKTWKDGIVVYNSDKSTPSPVLHQFDR